MATSAQQISQGDVVGAWGGADMRDPDICSEAAYAAQVVTVSRLQCRRELVIGRPQCPGIAVVSAVTGAVPSRVRVHEGRLGQRVVAGGS
ncbi:hypothetical protein GCM10027600_35960 [Nocardioides ginsengisegetis]